MPAAQESVGRPNTPPVSSPAMRRTELDICHDPRRAVEYAVRHEPARWCSVGAYSLAFRWRERSSAASDRVSSNLTKHDELAAALLFR